MKKTYQISVKLLSALHINGGTNANGVRITMKESVNGAESPYIPASVFKGILREQFARIWRDCIENEDSCIGRLNADKPCSCMVCKMFGGAGFQRSRIYIDRLTTAKKPNFTIRTNVSINRYCRTNQNAALVFSEVTERFDNTNTPDFIGDMTVYYPPQLSETEQRRIEGVLIEAAAQISYLGMGKSRGLGFVEVSLTPKETEADAV